MLAKLMVHHHHHSLEEIKEPGMVEHVPGQPGQHNEMMSLNKRYPEKDEIIKGVELECMSSAFYVNFCKL